MENKIKNQHGTEGEIYLMSEKAVSTPAAGTETPKMAEPPVVKTEPAEKTPFRIDEIPELRNENRKVYRMSDGTQQAAYYPDAIHVYNAETNFFDDLDTSLVEEENGRYFSNSRCQFKARFNREEDSDELFSVERGIYRVTISDRKNSRQKNHRGIPGKRDNDRLLFENVCPGADYEYSVSSHGIKEDIIVKGKEETYRYPFVLHCENVTVKHEKKDKRIVFIGADTGQEVFWIPAPFMYDADGVRSTAVSYETRSAANGDVMLTVIADSSWMNDEKRAFPVVIDPQIKLAEAGTMTMHRWSVNSGHSDMAYTVGAHTPYYDGCCDEKNTVSRVYLELAVPALPNNPRIKKAELTVFQKEAHSDFGGVYGAIGIYPVVGSIDAGQRTPSDELLDYAPIADSANASYTFDVTKLVDRALRGETHADLVLKLMEEPTESDDANWDNYVTLYGTDSTSSHRPQLLITYESGYEVNSSYRVHTHELGRFGQAAIDLQRGTLTFESEDFNWGGNRMPVTIRHQYNSALSGEQYTKNPGIGLHTADYTTMRLGKGWRLNVMQSMIPTDFYHDGAQCSGYVYTDENGAETYFRPLEDRIEYTDDDEAYCIQGDVEGNGLEYDSYRGTLKDGSQILTFAEGRLVAIKDEHGNTMELAYDGSDRLTTVFDGADRV